MMHHEFDTCDDCGKNLGGDAPYSIERPALRAQPTLGDTGEPLHACSTACLVRLATGLHRGLT